MCIPTSEQRGLHLLGPPVKISRHRRPAPSSPTAPITRPLPDRSLRPPPRPRRIRVSGCRWRPGFRAAIRAGSCAGRPRCSVPDRVRLAYLHFYVSKERWSGLYLIAIRSSLPAFRVVPCGFTPRAVPRRCGTA
jgi:hypothetical protein